MITTDNIILGIAVILFTGLLFGKLAKLIHVPNITGYLLGGLVIGPVLFGLLAKAFGGSFNGVLGKEFVSALELFVDIELGFIAFTVGSEFKMSYFKRVGVTPVVIAFAESFAAVIFITCGVTLVGLFFDMPFYFALCLGAVGGATAPAATIMVIRQYKARGELTQTLLSVVAIDDASTLIFFGVAMAIVKSIVRPGTNVALTVIMPFIEILGSLVLGVAVGFLILLVIKPFSSKGNRLVLIIAAIFTNIGICILINNNAGKWFFNDSSITMSFSSLLACMASGSIFCNLSDKVEDVMPLIENITPPLVVIFFILSGAGLDLEIMGGGTTWIIIALLTAYLVFRVAGKILGTWLSAKACKASPQVKKWLGFGLLPQGGIAIGLSLLVKSTLDGAPGVGDSIFNGQMLRVIVLFAVFVSEIFGPILCKFALLKSGEGHAPHDKKTKKALATAQNETPKSE